MLPRRCVYAASSVLLMFSGTTFGACYSDYALAGDASAEGTADDGARDLGSDAVCGDNLAGSMHSDPSGYGQWYAYFGDHVVESGTVVSARFAILPFDSGPFLVTLHGAGASLASASLSFSDGFVLSDSLPTGLVPYSPSGWNVVTWELDVAENGFDLDVNGVAQHVSPLSDDRGFVVNALSVLTGAPGMPSSVKTGWIDGVSVVLRSGTDETALFVSNFDDGVIAPLWQTSEGAVMEAEVPPLPLNDPVACGDR